MAPEKACKDCKTVVPTGSKCPSCGSTNLADSFKGKVVMINPEQSEIAKNLKINKKGAYAVKLG